MYKAHPVSTSTDTPAPSNRTVDERAWELCRGILRSGGPFNTLLHPADLQVLIEVCRSPGTLSASQQAACCEEVLHRLLKGGNETAEAVLHPDTGLPALTGPERARLRGLFISVSGPDFYVNRVRQLHEYKKAMELSTESRGFREALHAAISRLEQFGTDLMRVRVLLQNLQQEGAPGWAIDLQVGGFAPNDARLGKAFLQSARQGIADAAEWVKPYTAVNMLDSSAPVSLVKGTWPDAPSSNGSTTEIDYGSCFLPFAVASAFHAFGLRLPASVGLTGAVEGGRVTAVQGIGAKLKAARDECMHTVYAASAVPIPSTPPIETVWVQGGPVVGILNELALKVGHNLADTAAPALWRHLPPPYVSPSLSLKIDVPRPLPAVLHQYDPPLKVDLNAAWGLDRTKWIGVIETPHSQRFPDLLTSLIAFETALYERAQSFQTLPPVPARWWMPISCEASRAANNIQLVWAAAEKAWCECFPSTRTIDGTMEITPMELLRRFGLSGAVVPGFIISVPQAVRPALVAALVAKLFELLPNCDLAVVVCLHSDPPRTADDLAAALSELLPHVRNEVANFIGDEGAKEKPVLTIPGRANSGFDTWKTLVGQTPSDALLDRLLSQYERDLEDVWCRAIFGFCAHEEWLHTGGQQSEDRRCDVYAARSGRQLPWGR